MVILEVIPLSRGIPKETLSYFSKQSYPEGAIVSVPVRGRAVNAIVSSVRDASNEKSALRTADYALKKISGLKSKPLFRPAFMRAVANASEYFVATTGATLAALTPKALREKPELIGNPPAWGEDERPDIGFEKLLLQADRDERFSTYRSITREAFARKESIFLCVPTIHEAEECAASFEKGIAPYTICLHSDISKKELEERIKRAASEEHAVLIVGTPPFLSIPRRDIKTIIMERESAGAYKERSRPFIDMRVFGEMLAREIGVRFICADSLLRVETLFDRDRGKAAEFSRLRFRPLARAPEEVIDMREHTPTMKGVYDPISERLQTVIEEARDLNEHVFIWNARRGLASITVCADCGEVVRGTDSDAPMALHKTDKGNIFFSHHTGESRPAEERCRGCGSWKLTALGAGAERVEERLKELFPNAPIFRVDSDSTKTSKRARAVVADFYKTPGAILIGTEMAIPYLHDSIETVAVAGIDSLFLVPDYAIEERILGLLLTLRTLAQRHFILQTRNPKQRVLTHLTHGTLLEFYRNELELRKTYEYPPFRTLIRLSVFGTKNAVEKALAEIEESLSGTDVNIFSAFTPAPRAKVYGHAFLSLPADEWPRKDVVEKLRMLPPQVIIDVDPGRLL